MSKHINSSRNFFQELSPPNFDEDLAKNVLASNITRMIKVREMTLKKAADFLDINKSKVADLTRGHLSDFTIDSLCSLLKKLDPHVEQRLFGEYTELGLCWRHDDDWIAKLTAVLLPLSIAALTLPYLKEETPTLLAVVGGISLMAFWYFSTLISKRRFEIRFSRIYEIERILGLDSHLRYSRESEKKNLKHQRLRCWMFIGYLVVATSVMLNIRVGGPETEMQKTLQVLDFDVGTTVASKINSIWLVTYLVLVAIIIRIWIWIRNNDHKSSNAQIPDDIKST